MNYRTLADMARLCRENVHRIPRVDVVVGIPRSGTIAASMIATLTNQELRDPSQLGNCQYDSILLVDDSIAGGTTMHEMIRRITMWHPVSRTRIITLAVFVKPNSPMPDIHFALVPGPRVFEWNWHRSKHLSTAMLDIDGVISTETSPGERDKGQLLYRPARPVLALATGRHEHELEETEDWLEKHEVRYSRIFMSNRRQRARDTKVKACHKVKPKWFVESCIHQAEYIRAHTGLPVLCTDANVML